MNEVVETNATVKCRHCGQTKPADKQDPHLCVDCARAERNRYSYLRKNQGDWMAAAKDAGIDVWLQQPGETQHEYTIWSIYRDSYPGRKLTYREVAELAGTTKAFVGTVAQRWSFQARMQAWMAECDRITMLQRREEILHMNKEHIDMAQRLRDKMSKAIDLVDPAALKPSELGSLMRIATELERTARVDEIAQDEMRRELLHHDGENPEVRKSPTKQGDLAEVVKILMNAGVLGNTAQVGVRQTTEIVARTDNGDEVTVSCDN